MTNIQGNVTVQILLNEKQLRQGVDRVAEEISRTWGSRPMTIVGVLTGCVVFLADLIRQLDMPLRVDFIQASSYRGRATRGPLHIGSELKPDIEGRDVLVVDDIFDTGHTLVEVVAELKRHGPASIQTAVLLRKDGRQEVEFEPDFVAFHIPDKFVVGYGLDFQDEFRNLPYLGAIEPSDIQQLNQIDCGTENE